MPVILGYPRKTRRGRQFVRGHVRAPAFHYDLVLADRDEARRVGVDRSISAYTLARDPSVVRLVRHPDSATRATETPAEAARVLGHPNANPYTVEMVLAHETLHPAVYRAAGGGKAGRRATMMLDNISHRNAWKKRERIGGL